MTDYFSVLDYNNVVDTKREGCAIMIIYIDSLVFSNILIDYVLLLLTGLIVKRTYDLKRIIVAAVFGGLSSLYILVEETSIITDVVFKVISGSAVLLISQKFRSIKDFSVSIIVFMLLSFILSGFVEFIQAAVSSTVFVGNNLMNYINISPLLVIFLTIIIYLLIVVIKRCIERKEMVDQADLKIYLCGSVVNYRAIVDSGHNLSDPFSNSQVFILDSQQYKVMKSLIDQNEQERRKRLIPVETVGSSALLEGIRCDRADVISNSSTYSFNSPIVVASRVPLNCEADAIISNLVFSRLND